MGRNRFCTRITYNLVQERTYLVVWFNFTSWKYREIWKEQTLILNMTDGTHLPSEYRRHRYNKEEPLEYYKV